MNDAAPTEHDGPSVAWRAQRGHGDAWARRGHIYASRGGGAVRLPGIRLMASGLPHAKWNNADVDDPAVVDISEVVSWYAERAVPWGVSVPAGATWSHGRQLFRQRLMALPTAALIAAVPPTDFVIRAAASADLDAVLAVNGAAFDASVDAERPWLEPLLSADDAVVTVAYDGDRAVGCGYGIVADGDAGRTVYVAGIGVVASARRRGIGAAVTSWLVGQGAALGADLAHLNPDTDAAASVYRRLGFVEVPGFDIYVDIA